MHFDRPAFVGCLQRKVASDLSLGLVIFLAAPSGQPEPPEPESHVSLMLAREQPWKGHSGVMEGKGEGGQG
eukprot:8103313-Pyramimonas_sp.AAC.1